MSNNESYEKYPRSNGRSADIYRRPDPRTRRHKKYMPWLWGGLLVLALSLLLWQIMAARGREGERQAVVNPQIGLRDHQEAPDPIIRATLNHNSAPQAPDSVNTNPPSANPSSLTEAPSSDMLAAVESGDALNGGTENSGAITMTSFPKGYSPFAPASMAATKFFNENKEQFNEMEKIQVTREPGVVEFMIRLKFPETAPRSDDWNGNFQLESEPRVTSGIPHFIQWDERWGYNEYAGGPFGETGCGPTCLAMAYAGLTGRTDYPPNKMAEFATERYHAIDDVGTAWSLFDTGIEELGLSSEQLPVELEAFQDAIDDGKLILLSVKKGDFTSSGHFILLWNYDGQQFSILDPFNVQLGKRLWRFADLSKQCSMAWALWAD